MNRVSRANELESPCDRPSGQGAPTGLRRVSVTAMPENGPIIDIHNNALDALEVFVGNWRVEIWNAEWLDDGVRVGGRMSATWLDGRAFLVLRSVADEGPPASVQVIGRNEDRDDYTALYTDDRGVSRVYAMTFAGGEWTQFRADPGFHQRLSARLSADGRLIEGTWSKSHDGGESWEHDFDISYTRI